MDWKLVVSTFTAVFLAEIGDKTQIAVLSLTASSNRPLSVFIGAGLALLGATLMGVMVGIPVAATLPIAYLRKAGACVFIAIGIAMLADWL
jgi:putative Ca2+/H+ antiporter (TMEM165/GDT1 family)